MKMFRNLSLLVLIGLFCMSCSAKKTVQDDVIVRTVQNDVIVWKENFIGLINSNRIQVYGYNDNVRKWELMPELVMALPYEYKDVFGLNYDGETIVVTKDNKLQLYEFENFESRWISYFPLGDATLPKGYEDVFTFSGNFAIVAKDKIQFYRSSELENDVWSLDPDPDMADLILPEGYTDIFTYSSMIGVIIKDKIQLYDFDYETKKWDIGPEMNITLPKEYTSVFGSWYYIGVVTDDRIEFYYNYNDEGSNLFLIDPQRDLIR